MIWPEEMPSSFTAFRAMLPCGSRNLSFLMNISAVLLAGGESRRMGRDKATLLFRGRPLWEIQFDLLRTLQPEEIFVSARTDPPWRPSGMQFVSEDRKSTRLNSSHMSISYAVFCLKKKKK